MDDYHHAVSMRGEARTGTVYWVVRAYTYHTMFGSTRAVAEYPLSSLLSLSYTITKVMEWVKISPIGFLTFLGEFWSQD